MKKHEENKRLMSLDALRGFDMLFIMGLSGLIIAICRLFPDGADCWLATTMKHVKWHGLAHHDTIFPLFLFIAGISFPFSYAKQKANGMSQKNIYLKILKRFFILVALGIVYNGFFKLDFANLRICSVLGRIGFAWAAAAVLFINFKPMARAIICAAILFTYWLIVAYIPAPDVPGGDPLTMEGTIVGWVDRMITPGRLIYNQGNFDPEGILSAFPAIVTAMLGMFTGEFVRQPEEKICGRKKAGYMGLASLGLLAAGLVWSLVFPINKMLWSSSFVLVVGSYSLAMFALFYWIIDVKGWQKWTLFFRVVGMNSITIYMAQSIIGFGNIRNYFLAGFVAKLPETWGAVVNYAGYIAVCWLFLYFLYRHDKFLKI